MQSARKFSAVLGTTGTLELVGLESGQVIIRHTIVVLFWWISLKVLRKEKETGKETHQFKDYTTFVSVTDSDVKVDTRSSWDRVSS